MRSAKSEGTGSERGIRFTLPANNNELAAQIGAVREQVSRNMSRSQSEGFIEIDGRDIVVPDLTKLEAELADVS